MKTETKVLLGVAAVGAAYVALMYVAADALTQPRSLKPGTTLVTTFDPARMRVVNAGGYVIRPGDPVSIGVTGMIPGKPGLYAGIVTVLRGTPTVETRDLQPPVVEVQS